MTVTGLAERLREELPGHRGVASPRAYEAGFFDWETLDDEGDPGSFRWTRGARAYVLRPLWSPVVKLPFYMAHPAFPEEGVQIEVTVAGSRLPRLRIHTNGWHALELYLPALLGTHDWRDEPARVSSAGVGRRAADLGGEPYATFHLLPDATPEYFRVFDWAAPKGPPSAWFEIQVHPTFRPSDVVETEDRRELGIGVAEFLWASSVPWPGIGVYEVESSRGVDYRWTMGVASVPVMVPSRPAGGSARGRLRVRVSHPDARSDPVAVHFFWNEVPVAELDFADHEWRSVELAPAAGETSRVLTVLVERTWSPAYAGVSVDERPLGAAITEIAWQDQ